MKLLSTEQQNDLRELLEKVGSNNIETEAELQFWRIELKPKRIRKKQNILDTEEGVIEQAYREHTGGI